MVVLNTALHVLQFVQHSKHVDEFAQCEQVGFWHKVLPPLSMTEALHLTAEAFYGFPLQRYCKDWRDSPFSCKKILIALGTILPGSTWISWAWSLQALKPPLSSHKFPLCWVAHCILPVNHKRAPTHSWSVFNATVSTLSDIIFSLVFSLLPWSLGLTYDLRFVKVQ